MYTSMKHSFRPIYSILLLLLPAALFIIRIMLQGGIFTHTYDVSPVEVPQKTVFNETLLSYAAVDIAQPDLEKEVEQLLQRNFTTRGRKRSFLSTKKYDIWLRSSRGAMMQTRSPEFYRLWLKFRRLLADWFRNRRYDADVMSTLVGEVRSSIDERAGGEKDSTVKYKSCAVVGNSGILLKTEYGELIDSHEAVIRLNNARTVGFERNVGTKTNISFVNSNVLHSCARREGCSCHPYGPKVPIVMYMCQPAQFFDYLVCNSSHTAPLILTDSRFDVLCARIVKYYSLKRFVEVKGGDVLEWAQNHGGAEFHYSSGMQAIMLAVGICDKVSLFGFGKSQSSRHHYHTNQKAELSLHDYEAEYDFYRSLAENPREIPFVSDGFEFPRVIIYR